MRFNRVILIVIVVITILLGYGIIAGMKKARNELIVKTEQAVSLKEPEAAPYIIPENRIPSETEIDENIQKNRRPVAAKEETARKIKKEKLKAQSAKIDERAESKPAEAIPVKGPAQPAQKIIIPKKKEVRFPTHKERQKSAVQPVVIAY